ncbi:MAG: hypothetical protein GAK44_00179 [Pseudomonas delhiensis]|nr:MAG: hypothetical protein GAK44_00179 [Pseudomonas delhiensis]
MVEVDGHMLLVESFDDPRQFGLRRIVEDHQQPFGQFHVLELVARHHLYVGRVGLAEAMLRLDAQGALVAGLQAEQRLLEARQQIAVAHLEGSWLLVEGAVDDVAVFQLQREVQGNFRVRADTQDFSDRFSHGRLLRISWS